MGEEASVSKALGPPERWGVYAAGMAGKSRVFPWELCAPASCSGDREGAQWVGRSQQRARRIGGAIRGPHTGTRPDATTSCAAGGAARRGERLQRPGQAAAGSRQEPGVGRQTAPAEGEPIGLQTHNLLEAGLRREHLLRALTQGQAHKGAPGGDGMSVEALPDSLRKAWPRIREQLLKATYLPAPGRAVSWSTPGGGPRLRGIPTVLARWSAPAILQGLVPIFAPAFSERRYGVRPGRSAHHALEQSGRDMADG